MTFIPEMANTDGSNGKGNLNKSLHYSKDGFQNPGMENMNFGFKDGMKMLWKIPEFFEEEDVSKLETVENGGKFLQQNKKDFTVTWVGHSTLLVQMEGYNILTDPIWSERCSPFSSFGPKRFVKPGLDFEKLPKIDFVLISHDHYDHLDKETVLKLAELGVTFYVPLKVKSHFDDWGIRNVVELDWWDSINHGNLTIYCTSAQHFSGRGLFDRDKTLWSSWAVIGQKTKFYFAGDTGYFDGFKKIGEELGPFDLVAMPIGAYNFDVPHWRIVHTTPEEAVQAYLDVKGKFFVPIHWGTFRLALHPYDEPLALLNKEIEKRNLDKEKFLILKHGETKIWKKHAEHVSTKEKIKIDHNFAVVQ
jgi:L-ascorbate metabolism protein UlaG (beta-lactamase superfamily)